MKDIDGECNARLILGDDYGDNACTMRCGLTPGHEGTHRETFLRWNAPVVVEWVGDERPCVACDGTGLHGWTRKRLAAENYPDEAYDGPRCQGCCGSGIRTPYLVRRVIAVWEDHQGWSVEVLGGWTVDLASLVLHRWRLPSLRPQASNEEVVAATHDGHAWISGASVLISRRGCALPPKEEDS